MNKIISDLLAKHPYDVYTLPVTYNQLLKVNAQIIDIESKLKHAESVVEVQSLSVAELTTRNAELEAEVRKLKGALRKIREITHEAVLDNDDHDIVYTIASNALKESGL